MSENEKPTVLTTQMEGVEAVSKEEIEKILKQVDKEAAARKLTGLPAAFVPKSESEQRERAAGQD